MKWALISEGLYFHHVICSVISLLSWHVCPFTVFIFSLLSVVVTIMMLFHAKIQTQQYLAENADVGIVSCVRFTLRPDKCHEGVNVKSTLACAFNLFPDYCFLHLLYDVTQHHSYLSVKRSQFQLHQLHFHYCGSNPNDDLTAWNDLFLFIRNRTHFTV